MKKIVVILCFSIAVLIAGAVIRSGSIPALGTN